jgi:hypothetical protein
VNVFGDQAGNLGHWVADDVKECDNVGPSGEILKDFDLPLDFLLLDRLEDLDDALLLIDDVDALKNLPRM